MVFKCSAHISRRGSGSGTRRTSFPITTPVFHCNSTCGSTVVQTAQRSAIRHKSKSYCAQIRSTPVHKQIRQSPCGTAEFAAKVFSLWPVHGPFLFLQKRNGGCNFPRQSAANIPHHANGAKKPALDGPALSFNISCACPDRLPSRARPPAAPRRCRTW